MAEATKKAPAKASESDKALHTPAQQKSAGKTVSKSDAKALDKRREAQRKYTDEGGPDPQSYDEQAEHAQKVTATKQMMNTSDGTATEIEGAFSETPDYSDLEVPEPVNYQDVALELHDPEDVEYEDFPHAGVADDDPAGVAEGDPAGSAEKDDNYHGSPADAAALAKERVKDAEKAVEERTSTSQEVNTSDGTAKDVEKAKAKKD